MLRRALLALAVLSAATASAAASSSGYSPAEAAARWLSQQQKADGSIPAAGDRVDQIAEAAASAAAAGESGVAAKALSRVGRSGPSQATRGGQAGRSVMGIVAAGGDPRRLGGHDFVAHLGSFYDPATGRYDSNLYAHSLAVAGVKAAGGPVPEAALRYIDLNQCRDGGFFHGAGCIQPADVDTTAMAIVALIAGGRTGSDPVVARARQWLAAARNGQGGFGDAAGAATNANSCGLALSAIATLGEDPAAEPWASGGRSPTSALVSLQRDDGSFPYKAGGKADGYATVQAIPGLLNRSLPMGPTAAATSPSGQVTGSSEKTAKSSSGADSTPPGTRSTRSEAATGAAGPLTSADESTMSPEARQLLVRAREANERRGSMPLPLVAMAFLGLLSATAGSAAAVRRRLRKSV